jgi:signal transduction histidine kinase
MSKDLRDNFAAIANIAAIPLMLDVVCRATGMGFAAIARVTENRWECLAVDDAIGFGLKPGDELALETTICNEVRQCGEAIIIDHVAEDEFYRQHPTPSMYGFQSYISMPIFLEDGSFFGTLCAIDPKPAKLKNPATIGMFKLFAELIAFHLDANKRVAAAEADLLGARAAAQLQEQFIAVLGHDLRNPLASIAMGAELLQRTRIDAKSRSILARMEKSVGRMSALISDVLDLARGRLGGGLTLARSAVSLESILKHVVDELRAVYPGRIIKTEFDLSDPVIADEARIGQLFSNLLSNALKHGDANQRVRVRATTNGRFELVVYNRGAPISPAAMNRLFKPFSRDEVRRGQEGLGLGLYIASEIARAHGGTIDVTSSAKETSFKFSMPLDVNATAAEAHSTAVPSSRRQPHEVSDDLRQ